MLATGQLLSVDAEAVRQAVARLLEVDRLVRDTLAGITVIYLPQLYEAETYCSQSLLRFAQNTFPAPRGLDKMIRNVAKESGIEYLLCIHY